MNSIDLFVQNWGSKTSMIPISSHDITELEDQLTILLPESYKYLLSNFGLVHSPNVLTKICALGSELSEVQDFLSLDDVSSLSKLYEMSGMPKGHIVFASDCKGNMFCFKKDECVGQQEDVAVWFFNFDLRTMSQVSDSFMGWLTAFNEL